MKLVEFNYTKPDGAVSTRAVIEMVSPSQHFEGVDISALAEADFAQFTQAYRELKNAQHQATMQLLEDFDLKHNYRRFLPERMTNVVAEHI